MMHHISANMSSIIHENKTSIEAAQEAIAKVNAMLIAKGKLKPSQLGSSLSRKSGTQGNIVTKEVEINDVPIGCRNMLTRGATQEEISKMSGAAVATKGRYMTHEERVRHPKERPLYLHVQAGTQDAVNLAVGKINEIIANGIAKQGQRMGRFSPNFAPRVSAAPQPLLGPQPIQLLQEKLYIGLEHAPPNFSVKDKILGVGGSFLQHIQAETGAKVTVRGKGTGFIEMNGCEAPEPMHIHLQHVSKVGLQQAKDLATNLIQTVQQEYASFQQSLISMPPPNILPPPQPMMLPPQPHMVSLAQPPPLLPGQQILTSMPPPTLIQPPTIQAGLMPPPQLPGTVSVSLPAPGVVIPQLASTGQPMPGQAVHQLPPPLPSFSQPSNMPPPAAVQLVQSSDLGGQLASGQMLVSSGSQQPGQMMLTTVAGQQIQQPLPQFQPQLGPPGTIQFQQPGPISMQPQPSIPQQVLPPPGFHPPPATMHQVTISPQPQQPPPIFVHQQQAQPTAPPGQQSFLQQPILQNNIQQLPTGSMTIIQQPGAPSHPSPTPQPLHSVDQPPPLGAQGGVSWGSARVTFSTVHSTVPIQQAGSHYVHQPQIANVAISSAQSGEMIMSSPATPSNLVVTSSSVNAVTSSASNYVYKSGPTEEPRRRFTEEKQEDKLPEGLLGYEHGPPHLTNLMVQPGQNQQHTPTASSSVAQPDLTHQPTPPVYAGQVLQQVGGAPVQQAELQHQPPQQVVYAQPAQQQHVIVAQPSAIQQQSQQLIGQQQPYAQHHIIQHPQHVQPQIQTAVPEQHRASETEISVPPPPVSQVPGYIQNGEPVQQATTEDQMLMPPPPPPMNTLSLKRQQSPGLSTGSEPRKKAKGIQENDDDDRDIPSSMSSQIKEFRKYSFNQYSSTPQLYRSNSPQINSYGQYTSAVQNGSTVVSQSQQVITDYAGYQTDQTQRKQFATPPQQQEQPIGQFATPPQQQEQPVSQFGTAPKQQLEQPIGQFATPPQQPDQMIGQFATPPQQPEQPVGQFSPLTPHQQQPEQHIRPQHTYIAASTPQPTFQYGQTQAFTQYSVPNPPFVPPSSSPSQQISFSQPPPPPPPMFDQGQTEGSRSPNGEDKLRMIKYVSMPTQDEQLLTQPPPPPRSYW